MSLPLLLTLAGVLAGPVPTRLVRARWVYRAPRLGVLAWLAITHTILACLLLAGLTALLPWDHSHALACATWHICFDALRGAHGPVGQAIAVLGLALLVVLLLRVAAASGRLWATASQQRRHTAMLAIIGRSTDGGATVIARPEPAAYLVPGRHSRVVVTTGAMDLLAADELAAVLAHERAHASGRHHRLLALGRLPHQAFPPLATFRHAREQIARLVEICADDTAARDHSPLALARALVAMAMPTGPAAMAMPTGPAGVLPVNGGAVAERIGRLIEPPAPLSRSLTAAITFGLCALPLLPVVIAAVGRVAPFPPSSLWTP